MGIQTKELQTTALLQSTTLEIFLQYRSQLSTYKTNTTTNPNTPNLSKYGSRRSFNRQVPLQGQDRGLRHLRRRRRVRREVEDRQEHSPRSGSAPSRCSSASKASKVPSTAPPTKHSRPNSAPARRKKLSSRSSRREPCKRLRVWPDKAPRTTAWVPAPATKRLAPLHPLLPH